MSDAFLNHPARDTVRAILALEGDQRFIDSALEAGKYRHGRDRFFALAHAVDGMFERSSPAIVSLNGLNQLQGSLQNMLNELSAYVSNGNAAHIGNAIVHCDQALQQLWAFGPPVESMGKRALGEIFKAQEKASNTYIAQLQMQHDGLAEQLQQALQRASELQSQVDSFRNTLSKTASEAAAAVAKLDTQFTNEERERSRLFQEKISDNEGKFVEQTRVLSEAAGGIITDLENKQAQAAKIVQVVGNIGITGNYQRIAKDEGRVADTWRIITVVIFLVGITVAVSAFLRIIHEPISSENFWSVAIRMLFAIGVTGPAWYTSKESARHRTNADRARKLELELASLGPFIELLPVDQKHQIREKLTHVYFGGSDVEPHTPGSLVDISAMKEMLVDVLKVAKR